MVMGWCGLSQAWLRATDIFGDSALGLGLVAAFFALLVFMLLCLASIVRLHAHPNAVAADMRHPVRHAFLATLPVSILLLANLGITLFWGTGRTLDMALTFVWCVGSVLEIAATVWVISRWLKSTENGGMQWATFTPVFFIPVVGNVLAPLGGVSIGLEAWATAQFGVGLFLWLVLQTLFFVRLGQAGPLPARLTPSLLITVVPPSISGLSLLQLDAPPVHGMDDVGRCRFFLGAGTHANIRHSRTTLQHGALGHELPLGCLHRTHFAYDTRTRWRMVATACNTATGHHLTADFGAHPQHLTRSASRPLAGA